MRHFFVINPHSFPTPEDVKRVVAEIPRYFIQKPGVEYKIHTSRYPRDAITIIHRYLEKVPPQETVRIYAIGGDGLLFDCLNGITNFPNAELTNVPFGNGCNFLRVFGESASTRFKNIPGLINGASHPTDIIDFGSNYAVNHVAIGVEAEAAINAKKFIKRFKSIRIKPIVGMIFAFYKLLAVLNNEITGQWYRINIDGDDFSGRYFIINIANGPCSGYKLKTSPNAMPNDGLLNVIFGKSGRFFTMLRAFVNYSAGQFEKDETFTELKIKEIRITSNTTMRVYVDGEVFFTYALKMEVMKNQIRFVSPICMEYQDFSLKGGRGR